MVILIGGASFVMVNMEQWFVRDAKTDTYYADAIGQRRTDMCNRVRVTVAENPVCPRLTRNDPGTCRVISSSKNNVSSYALTIQLQSNDGNAHTINYGNATSFCTSSTATTDATGYCTCIQNEEKYYSLTSSVPSNGVNTITLSRPNPYGASCGTYQMDFWINSVDGNSSCSYGNSTIVGASGLCETGTACSSLPVTNSISGNVYVDANKNGRKDTGESNYSGSTTITTSRGSLNTNTNGTYTISGISAGAVTVSYPTLPADYSLTYPLNGPPPSYNVTVGSGCTTNGVNDANCSGGNITNLNFGITNLNPWMQAVCGSMRMDDGITSKIPSTASGGAFGIITSSALCTTPGIAYSGDSVSNWGSGTASSNNWIVGGATYPEVYTPSSNTGLMTSPDYLIAKANQTAITPVNLATICNISNCTLPSNLQHGIYQANGTVFLNAFTAPANQNYIIIVNGSLIIKGNVIVPNGSTVVFSTTGDTVVRPEVGGAANSTATTLEGIYSSNRSFFVERCLTAGCNDLRLNVAGAVIINANGSGGAIYNQRDLLANDANYPTLTFSPRLDFLFNLPDFVKQSNMSSLEVAP